MRTTKENEAVMRALIEARGGRWDGVFSAARVGVIVVTGSFLCASRRDKDIPTAVAWRGWDGGAVPMPMPSDMI